VDIYLNGDTGISEGVKEELYAIRFQPKIIPIFDTVQFPGENAMYHIVEWACIEITDVKLTGPMHKKRVDIVPSTCVTQGVIPADPGSEQVSTGIYSVPLLVR
jgi:hypothetical protein